MPSGKVGGMPHGISEPRRKAVLLDWLLLELSWLQCHNAGRSRSSSWSTMHNPSHQQRLDTSRKRHFALVPDLARLMWPDIVI